MLSKPNPQWAMHSNEKRTHKSEQSYLPVQPGLHGRFHCYDPCQRLQTGKGGESGAGYVPSQETFASPKSILVPGM